MSERPWYKRYPSDFIAGTLGLTAEQKGVYSTLLDLMYDRGAPIADDPVELARISGCSTRRFNVIKAELAERKKIVLRDGLISNARFEHQTAHEKKEHEKLSQNGRKGAAKTSEKPAASNDRNGLAEKGPPPEKPAYQNPETRKKEDGGDARAREEAYALADQIAVIAGHDPKFLPPSWMSGGHGERVKMWLASGWKAEIIIPAVRAGVASLAKGDVARSIKFFEQRIARAHAQVAEPLPTAQPQHQPQPQLALLKTVENTHATTQRSAPATSWQQSRDAFRSARADLKARLYPADLAPGGGGEGGGPAVRLAATPRRE